MARIAAIARSRRRKWRRKKTIGDSYGRNAALFLAPNQTQSGAAPLPFALSVLRQDAKSRPVMRLQLLKSPAVESGAGSKTDRSPGGVMTPVTPSKALWRAAPRSLAFEVRQQLPSSANSGS